MVLVGLHEVAGFFCQFSDRVACFGKLHMSQVLQQEQ